MCYHVLLCLFFSPEISVFLFSSLDCISTANGSALVKVGNTTIICGIKAVNDDQEPFLTLGWVNVDGKVCSWSFYDLQELSNPTVEAPGKGYIGEYSTVHLL